ncbi:MAG: thiamine pyrophosphate-dependent enzyme [Longimicrobiales bacterium]|nr:thiamine pyrophosphate-dependent enzyme [Longimicrobiales bacterium]
MDLLGDLVRARALERALDALSDPPGSSAPRLRPPAEARRISPAVPAARALGTDPRHGPDALALRAGSVAAALVRGVGAEELLRAASAPPDPRTPARDPEPFPHDPERGLIAPFRRPGSLMEVMAGVALSFRIRAQPRVALLLDRASSASSGDWHEGLCVAAAREVPLVVVVDGGERAGPPLTERGEAYGYRVWQVEDRDPRAVEAVVREAVGVARGGGGPCLVEVSTGGGVEAGDPAAWLEETLRAAGGLGDEAVDRLVGDAEAEIAQALARVLEGVGDPAPVHPQPNAWRTLEP